MIILHVSSITNNQASGMSVVIPLHVQYQSKYAKVALLNCSNAILDIGEQGYTVFTKQKDFIDGDISKLPSPYNNPDLVVIHGVYIPFYSKIVKSLLKNNIPYIVVPHGSLARNAQKSKRIKKVLGNFLIFNRIIKNATAIQYLSVEEQKSSISKNSIGFVGFNGMSLSSVNKSSFSPYNNLNLIFIGRLDPFHKGIDMLLEACNLIQNEMRQKKIVLSIYGPDHEGGKEVISNLINSYNIGDIVKLNGGIFGDRKIDKLMESDVFIQTSRFEGQPLGVMEALSYGIPVIVTPGTNMAEDVMSNACGWKTEPNAKEIARTILEVDNSKEILNVYSRNAVEYIKDTFDWGKIAKNTVGKYRELINKDEV